MIARLLVLLFAIVVVAAGLGVGYFVLGDGTPFLGSRLGQMADPLSAVDPQDTSMQVVTVTPGSTAGDIGTILQQRGLIRSGLLFRLAAEQAGVGSSLAAGDYELSRSMTTNEIIQVLAKGQVKRGLMATIPEGWRSEQIADRLEATGVASREEFLGAVNAPQSVPGFEVVATTTAPQRLEGYLFPETYEVTQRVAGSRAAELMVRMFNERVGERIRTTNESNLTPYQALTLASIVEREARQASERPTIASVYLNRLAVTMPLQADPTVQYAIASRDGPAAAAYKYWKDLSPADLSIDSPYNTYQAAGLPPGPICNPGEASIRAVLQPAKTEYMYFVANSDGSGTHLFARTLAEHNANVAKVSQR
ncbi:MAG: endolytic transglycosylase MltG [Chloroflexota bacterium]